jgi:hypothetical protein
MMTRFDIGLTAITVAATAVLCAAQEEKRPLENDPKPNAEIHIDKTAKEPVSLNKEGTVLLDAKAKKLIINSEIALREGMLEMLLCKRQTKEHESILAFEGKAYIVHAGLVALGIDPGKPVTFDPEYVAPQGPKLKIDVVWKDKDGKEHREDARQWIRYAIHRFFGEPLAKLPAGLTLPKDSELRYDDVNKELSWYGPMSKKQRDDLLALSDDAPYQAAIRSFFKRSQERPMNADWVFAGSAFVQDEASGHRIYLAESGDVICVANFPSAMIDIAMKSSSEGQENLMFEAWTEHLPPIGTPVRLEITPVAKKPDGPAKKAS